MTFRRLAVCGGLALAAFSLSCASGVQVVACEPGYAGDGCTQCAAGFQDDDGDGTCLCTDGFQDNDQNGTCERACSASLCGAQGMCSDTTGAPVCTCAPGFAGVACDKCADNVASAVYLFSADVTSVAEMGGRAGINARVKAALPTNLPGAPTATYRSMGFISITGDAVKDLPTNHCVPAAVPVFGIDPSNGMLTQLATNWADLMDGTIAATMGAALGYQDFNYFWSGSDNDGSANGHDCNGWTTNTTVDASISNRSNVTTNWLGSNPPGASPCGASRILVGLAYCVAGCP